MCRNIKKLRNPERTPTDAELHDAQHGHLGVHHFVEPGLRVPPGRNDREASQANKEAFDEAVENIAHAGRHLFEHLAAPGTHVHAH